MRWEILGPAKGWLLYCKASLVRGPSKASTGFFFSLSFFLFILFFNCFVYFSFFLFYVEFPLLIQVVVREARFSREPKADFASFGLGTNERSAPALVLPEGVFWPYRDRRCDRFGVRACYIWNSCFFLKYLKKNRLTDTLLFCYFFILIRNRNRHERPRSIYYER